MVSHMKTTLNIDDGVMARSRRTMSELVAAGLRLVLQSGSKTSAAALPALPRFRSGGLLVDVADREELYRAMGQD